MDVKCQKCKKVICSSDQLCWLQRAPSRKNPNGVRQLVIKPEKVFEVFEHKSLNKKPERSLFILQCTGCSAKLGTNTNFDGDDMYYLPEAKIETNLQGIREIRTLENLKKFLNMPAKIEFKRREIVKITKTTDIKIEDLKLIQNKQVRVYQMDLFYQIMSVTGNSLVILPTGCGKTIIAFLVMLKMNELNPDSLCVFICETVALAEQQYEKFKNLTDISCEVIYGSKNSHEIKKDFTNGKWRVVFMTAGLLIEYLKNEIILISNFHTLIIDECHNIHVNLLNFYKNSPNETPKIIGLSASPVRIRSNELNFSSMKEIQNQLIELQQFYNARLVSPSTEFAKNEVKQFMQDANIVEVRDIPLNYNEIQVMENIRKIIESNINSSVKPNQLKTIQAINSLPRIFKNEILNNFPFSTQQLLDIANYISLFGLTNAIKSFDQKYQDNAFKQQIFTNITNDQSINAQDRVQIICDELKTSIGKKNNEIEEFRGLIFVDSREIGVRLKEELSNLAFIAQLNPKNFFGHSSDQSYSMSTEEQKTVMTEFINGETKLLIATSVLEEGIDIPSCNFVVSYERRISLKTFLQVRGRARDKNSKFLIFSSEKSKIESIRKKEIFVNTCVTNICNQAPSNQLSIFIDSILKLQMYSNDISKKKTISYEKTIISLPENCFVIAINNLLSFEYDKEILIENFKENTFLIEENLTMDGNYFVLESKGKIENSIVEILFFAIQNRFCFQLIKEFKIPGDNLNLYAKMETGYIVNHEFYRFDRYESTFELNFESNDKIELIDQHFDEIKIIINYENIHCIFIELNPQNRISIYFVLHYIPKITSIDYSIEHTILRLSLDFNLEKLFKIHNILHKNSNFKIYYKNFEYKNYNYSMKLNNIHSNWNENEKYSYEVFYSHSGKRFESSIQTNSENIKKLHEILSINNLNKKELFYYLYKTSLKNYFINLFDYLYDNHSNFIDYEDNKNYIPDDHIEIKLAIVTPDKTYFKEKRIISNNSIFRKFDSNHFILVYFTENDFSALKKTSAIYMARKLYSGISLMNCTYFFLGCSNSQLKKQNCYFLKENSIPKSEIFNYIGDIHSISPEGKKMSRIALAFSSSLASISFSDIGIDKIYYYDDIERNNLNFTDGCGLISYEGMCKIKDSIFNLQSTDMIPSVIQVRIGGFKGILLFDKTLKENEIILRKSMKKFDSNRENIIEIISISTESPGFLNSQLITLLTSRKIEDETFFNIQIKNFNKVFDINHSKLYHKLFPYLNEIISENKNIITKHSSKIHKFLNLLVIKRYFNLINNPLKLYVPKSRNAIIVPDPHGLLKEGEIFFQPFSKSCCIEGKVILCKFPAHFPGDVLICNAIKIKEWENVYYNVIIVPTVGEKPLASQSSGGDYDGDRFFISWEQSIIPKESCLPTDFDKLQEKYNNKQLQNNETKIQFKFTDELNRLLKSLNPQEEFFCSFFVKDLLGKLSRIHLASCNTSKDMAFHSDCIQLAETLSITVDSIKNEKSSLIINENLWNINYPKFMNESSKISCDSILQKLYDRTKNLIHLIPDYDDDQKEEKMDETENEIQDAYHDYSIKLQSILDIHCLSSEYELLLCIFDDEKQISGSLDIAQLQLLKLWQEILEKYSNLLKNKKWFWINYPFQYHRKFKSFILFAFYSNTSNKKETKINLSPIAKSIKKYWFSIKKHKLIENYSSALDIKNNLQSKIPSCKIEIFGSTSLFIGNEASDFDLSINSNDNKLLLELSDEIKLILKCPVKPLNIFEDQIHGFRAFREGRNIDIIFNAHKSLLKKHLISSYMIQNPFLIILINLFNELAKSMELRSIIGNPSSFGISWLIIQYCIDHNLINQIQIDEITSNEENLFEIIKSEENFDFEKIKEILLEILRFYSIYIPNKTIDPINNQKMVIDINDDKKNQFLESFFYAYQSVFICSSVTPLKDLLPLGNSKITWKWYTFEPFPIDELKKLHNDIQIRHIGKKIEITATGKRDIINKLSKFIKPKLIEALRGRHFIENSCYWKLFDVDPYNDEKVLVKFINTDNREFKRNLPTNICSPIVYNYYSNRNLSKAIRIHFESCLYKIDVKKHAEIEVKIRFGKFIVRNVNINEYYEKSTIDNQISRKGKRKEFKKKPILVSDCANPNKKSNDSSKRVNKTKKKDAKKFIRSLHHCEVSENASNAFEEYLKKNEYLYSGTTVKYHVTVKYCGFEFTIVYDNFDSIPFSKNTNIVLCSDILKRCDLVKDFHLAYHVDFLDFAPSFRSNIVEHKSIPEDFEDLSKNITIDIKNGNLKFNPNINPNGTSILFIRVRNAKRYIDKNNNVCISISKVYKLIEDVEPEIYHSVNLSIVNSIDFVRDSLHLFDVALNLSNYCLEKNIK